MKELTDRKHSVKSNSGCIQSKNGTPLFESEEIEKSTWIGYISELYKDDTCIEAMKFNECEGPETTADEVERGRKSMKDKKTAGIDGITAEVLKAL